MAISVPITLDQMDELLAPLGFTTIGLPGTVETVFAKAYRRTLVNDGYVPLSLRVYTSIAGDTSRETGEDAIRVVLLANTAQGRPVLGTAKRVHRVVHWRENLMQRLTTWENLIPCFCDCGAPMLLRKPKNGARWQPFYGCILYPTCTGSKLA